MNWVKLGWIVLNWTRLGWIVLCCIELCCIWGELCRIGLNCVKLDLIWMNLVELDWIKLNEVEFGCILHLRFSLTIQPRSFFCVEGIIVGLPAYILHTDPLLHHGRGLVPNKACIRVQYIRTNICSKDTERMFSSLGLLLTKRILSMTGENINFQIIWMLEG